MNRKKIKRDDDDMNCNDPEGLILGLYCRPNRMGYHHVLDFCEDGGHRGSILTKVRNLMGKMAYFYIFESYDDKPDDLKLNDWKKFKESNTENFGMIFGEGKIKEVKDGKIIYQYVKHYHYHNYVDIDETSILLERINELNKNKSVKSKLYVKKLIAFGLPITKDECEQISSLATLSKYAATSGYTDLNK